MAKVAPENESKDGIITQEPGKEVSRSVNQMLMPPVMMPGQVYAPVGGLQELAFTSHFFVRQHIEPVEVCCGCETPNSYTILNTMGLPTFHLQEITNECTVLCLGTMRCFQFEMKDNFGQVVLLLERTCVSCFCGCVWCNCCGNNVIVSLPDGTVLGTAKQTCSCAASFDVLNANNQPVFKIRGPCCGNCCKACVCGTVAFDIFEEEQQIGTIHKQWSGVVQEFLTDADNFGAEFPLNLDIELKALLFGALLLIDFVHFEHGEGLFCKVLHVLSDITNLL